MKKTNVLLPQVLFEDEHILVIDKPSGLLTVPDRFDKKEENLRDWLRLKQKSEIFVVHRLDKDTSGLVIFAKTEESHRHLSLQFEMRFARKEYLALVQGPMPDASGSLTYAMSEDLRHPGRMLASPLGKSAQTDYTVLESFTKAGYDWLSLRPLTGRTHQIRVHLQAAGYPVVGDAVYGSGDRVLLSRLKRGYKLGKYQEEKPLLCRMALHAHRLCVKHPGTDKTAEFEAPMPKDLEVTLGYLRRFGA